MTSRQKRLCTKPWITKDLLISIKKCKKLHKALYLSQNLIDRDIHKKFSKLLTHIQSLSKRIYYHNVINKSKNNPVKICEEIRDLLGGKKSSDISPSLNVNGKNVEDSLRKTEVFNNCFGDIGCNLASKIDQRNQNFRTFLYKFRKVGYTANKIG